MPLLRGITWDHPRGLGPLLATAETFHGIRPDIAIEWHARSLKDFGDYPIEPLCEQYDLIMVDHPFMGTGVEKALLLALDEWLPADYLADQAANSVGPSYASYTWAGHQWALAADAAAQVAALRADLLTPLDLPVPRSWEEVEQLARLLPQPLAIAMPLVPTDAVCSFISVAANLGGPDFWQHEAGIDPAVGTAALDHLRRLVPLLHPASLHLNPPQTLDRMAREGDIVYVPLLFGYSNYSRPGFAPGLIHFTDIPSSVDTPRGSILGGVGLAISAFSEFKAEAVAYAQYVANGDVQRTVYFEAGGQPGHRAAWLDPGVNEQAGGFFARTLATLDHAYVRPRWPGFNVFQERAGETIHAFLQTGGDPRQVVSKLNDLYDRSVTRGPSPS